MPTPSATGEFAANRYTFVNNLLNQVKGRTNLTALDTGEQVTNFTNTIYGVGDPLVTRLSQLVGRTLMAVRPYESRLGGIEVTSEEYGWITRKINFLDDEAEENVTFTLTNGQSVDPWIVNKPKVVETQSYGGGQITRHMTIFEDQIKGAFTSAGALDEFISRVLMHFNNQVEQDREQYKRTALINLMGCLALSNDRCIYLITEYNNATGSNLDATTVFAPANFEPFTQWLYGYIQKLIGLMSERSYMFHLNPTGATPVSGRITRQTSLRNMRVFMNMGFKADMAARVVANTFNRDELREVQYESVNFWQNIKDPTSINVNVKTMTNALQENPAAPVSLNNVFGLLMDRDALAVSYMNDNTGNSPYNQRGRYYNIFHNEDVKIVQDLTENAVLLVLDVVPGP